MKILKGFTFIELITVISIIGIITVVGFPRFNNFKNSQTHNSEVSNVLSLFNEARVRAVSGDNAKAYSVSIDTNNKTFLLFRVTTLPGDTPYSELITMNNKISLSTNISGNTVTFNRYTGFTENSGIITIVTTSGSFNKTSIVRIYPNGLAAID